jgi:hypothetical protein
MFCTKKNSVKKRASTWNFFWNFDSIKHIKKREIQTIYSFCELSVLFYYVRVMNNCSQIILLTLALISYFVVHIINIRKEIVGANFIYLYAMIVSIDDEVQKRKIK